MKNFKTIILTMCFAMLLPISVNAMDGDDLAITEIDRAGRYIKWQIVCTSDGSALSATDVIGEMSSKLARLVRGSALMKMKVVPGTGGVIPNTTIDITLTDDEDDELWSDTTITQNSNTWHTLSADISIYPPVFDELKLALNDFGDVGDTVTLIFIGYIE